MLVGQGSPGEFFVLVMVACQAAAGVIGVAACVASLARARHGIVAGLAVTSIVLCFLGILTVVPAHDYSLLRISSSIARNWRFHLLLCTPTIPAVIALGIETVRLHRASAKE